MIALLTACLFFETLVHVLNYISESVREKHAGAWMTLTLSTTRPKSEAKFLTVAKSSLMNLTDQEHQNSSISLTLTIDVFRLKN